MKTTHFAALLLIAPLTATASPVAGDRTFTLSGTGTSDDDFDNNIFSSSLEVGYFSTQALQYQFRQNISYFDSESSDSQWNGASRVAADYHFGSDSFFPFIGASLGGVYGDTVDDTFSGGIEFGMKYYARQKTYISALVDYQFFFDSGDDIDNNFDDGEIFYSLGVGFHF